MNKLKVVELLLTMKEMPSVRQYSTQGITKRTMFFVQQYAQCVIDRLLMSYMSYFRQRRNILEFRNTNEYPKDNVIAIFVATNSKSPYSTLCTILPKPKR